MYRRQRASLAILGMIGCLRTHGFQLAPRLQPKVSFRDSTRGISVLELMPVGKDLPFRVFESENKSKATPQNAMTGPLGSEMSRGEMSKANSGGKMLPKTYARLMLLVSAALYGTNFATVKVLDESLPPPVAATLRFFLAASVTGMALLASPRRSRSEAKKTPETLPVQDTLLLPEEDLLSGDGQMRQQETKTWDKYGPLKVTKVQGALLWGLMIGGLNSFGYIAQAMSLAMGSATGRSALICSMAVLFVPVWDAVVGQKSSSSRQWLAVLSAAVGLCFLELGPSLPFMVPGGLDVDLGLDIEESIGMLSDTLSGGSKLADMVGLVQPVAFGLGFVSLEEGMKRYPAYAKEITFTQLMGTALMALLWMVLDFSSCVGFVNQCGTHGGVFSELCAHPEIGAALLWTGLATTAFTMYLETSAITALSAADATLLLTTEPVWALLWGALLLKEGFGSGIEILGAGMILSACFGAIDMKKD